jgi:hypothetical protein
MQELAKTQDWGCPRIPFFFQIILGFQFPTYDLILAP